MAKNLEIDEKIFCTMARHYGAAFNLPPLAAKIYAYLLFDFDREGLAFDDFVEIFSSCKSSVSTNLNLLITQQLIIDRSRIDERKRYFVINEDYTKIRLRGIVDRLTEEVQIIENVTAFRQKNHEKNPKAQIYKAILLKNIKNIEESLTKL